MTLWVLTACSQQILPSFSDSSDSSQSSSKSTEAPSAASNEGMSTPIVAPPSYDNRPAEPGQMPTQETMPNGLPALQPLKGVNVSTLFSENINDSDKRFDRLENAVLDLRKEFEVMKPAIVRLVAVESDIQELVQQLEGMALAEASRPAPVAPVMRENTQANTPANAPTSLVPDDMAGPADSPDNQPGAYQTAQSSTSPAAAIPKVAEPYSPPAAANPPPSRPPDTSGSIDGTIVQNLRTGKHPGKVRLVLDTNKKTPFTIDLDSGENILLIEMPDAKWQGPASHTFPAKDTLLASYNVESINGGKGSRIVITLKRQTSILKQQALPPGPTPNHRVYVDLKL